MADTTASGGRKSYVPGSNLKDRLFKALEKARLNKLAALENLVVKDAQEEEKTGQQEGEIDEDEDEEDSDTDSQTSPSNKSGSGSPRSGRNLPPPTLMVFGDNQAPARLSFSTGFRFPGRASVRGSISRQKFSRSSIRRQSAMGKKGDSEKHVAFLAGRDGRGGLAPTFRAQTAPVRVLDEDVDLRFAKQNVSILNHRDSLVAPASVSLPLKTKQEGLPHLELSKVELPQTPKRSLPQLKGHYEQLAGRFLQKLPAFASASDAFISKLVSSSEIVHISPGELRELIGPARTSSLQGRSIAAVVALNGRFRIEIEGQTVEELTAGQSFGFAIALGSKTDGLRSAELGSIGADAETSIRALHWKDDQLNTVSPELREDAKKNSSTCIMIKAPALHHALAENPGDKARLHYVLQMISQRRVDSTQLILTALQCSEAAKHIVARCSMRYVYMPGDILVHQGHRHPDGLISVRSGSLQLSINGAEIRRVEEGQVIGEDIILNVGQKWTFSAVCLTPCDIVILHRRPFTAVVKEKQGTNDEKREALRIQNLIEGRWKEDRVILTMPLFRGLDPEFLGLLAKLMEMRVVFPGNMIWEANSSKQERGLFILLTGQAEEVIERDSSEVSRVVRRTLQQGACFGNREVLGLNEPERSKVTAQTHCIVAVLHRSVFRHQADLRQPDLKAPEVIRLLRDILDEVQPLLDEDSRSWPRTENMPEIIPLLRTCEKAFIECLRQTGSRRFCIEGQYLCRAGVASTTLFLVLRGEAKVSIDGVTVRTCVRGDIVNMLALANHPFVPCFNAVCARASEVWSLTREDLQSALADFPSAKRRLATLTAAPLHILTPVKTSGEEREKAKSASQSGSGSAWIRSNAARSSSRLHSKDASTRSSNIRASLRRAASKDSKDTSSLWANTNFSGKSFSKDSSRESVSAADQSPSRSSYLRRLPSKDALRESATMGEPQSRRRSMRTSAVGLSVPSKERPRKSIVSLPPTSPRGQRLSSFAGTRTPSKELKDRQRETAAPSEKIASFEEPAGLLADIHGGTKPAEKVQEGKSSRLDLGHVELFKGCSPAFIAWIEEHLETTICFQDSVLFREGDQNDSFYIIHSGTVISEGTNTLQESLQHGRTFGELQLLGALEQTSTTAVAATVSLLKVLHRPVFVRGMQLFPDQAGVFDRFALKWLEKVEGLDLKSVPFFQDCNEYFLDEAARFARARIAHPGEVIVEKGARHGSLCIILSGKVMVEDPDTGKCDAILGKNDCVNAALVMGVISQAPVTVRAQQMCCISEIAAHPFRLALRSHPQEVPGLVRKVCSGQLWPTEMDAVPFLHGFAYSFFHRLIEATQWTLFGPDKTVVRQDGTGDTLFILCYGVAVQKIDDVTLEHPMSPGDVIGAANFLGLAKQYTSTIRTLGVCHFRTITYGDLQRLLTHQPSERDSFAQLKDKVQRQLADQALLQKKYVSKLKLRRRVDEAFRKHVETTREARAGGLPPTQQKSSPRSRQSARQMKSELFRRRGTEKFAADSKSETEKSDADDDEWKQRTTVGRSDGVLLRGVPGAIKEADVEDSDSSNSEKAKSRSGSRRRIASVSVRKGPRSGYRFSAKAVGDASKRTSWAPVGIPDSAAAARMKARRKWLFKAMEEDEVLSPLALFQEVRTSGYADAGGARARKRRIQGAISDFTEKKKLAMLRGRLLRFMKNDYDPGFEAFLDDSNSDEDDESEDESDYDDLSLKGSHRMKSNNLNAQPPHLVDRIPKRFNRKDLLELDSVLPALSEDKV